MNEMGYDKGYVMCPDCENLESYWRAGRFAYFKCKFKPLKMSKLESRWRKCGFFVPSKESPLDHKKTIEVLNPE